MEEAVVSTFSKPHKNGIQSCGVVVNGLLVQKITLRSRFFCLPLKIYVCYSLITVFIPSANISSDEELE